jgi:hypothetical protein
MNRRIRRAFEETKGQNRHRFDDFDRIIRRCLREYGDLFPGHEIKNHGNRYVYHFNVDDLHPISLEKEHGSREYIPRHFAKLAILGIEDLLTYIETHAAAELETEEVIAELASGAQDSTETRTQVAAEEADPDSGAPAERDSHDKLE